MRDVLSFRPARHKAAMTAGLKRLFGSEDVAEARVKALELAEQMDKRADRALECLENGPEDTVAVYARPCKVPSPSQIHKHAGAAQSGSPA